MSKIFRQRIETISKAHGFPLRTVALNSLKPATKKDREQEIFLFPAFFQSSVPPNSPSRITARTGSQR